MLLGSGGKAAAAIQRVGQSVRDRRASTMTAPAMAPVAAAVIPWMIARTDGTVPHRLKCGAAMAGREPDQGEKGHAGDTAVFGLGP